MIRTWVFILVFDILSYHLYITQVVTSYICIWLGFERCIPPLLLFVESCFARFRRPFTHRLLRQKSWNIRIVIRYFTLLEVSEIEYVRLATVVLVSVESIFRGLEKQKTFVWYVHTYVACRIMPCHVMSCHVLSCHVLYWIASCYAAPLDSFCLIVPLLVVDMEHSLRMKSNEKMNNAVLRFRLGLCCTFASQGYTDRDRNFTIRDISENPVELYTERICSAIGNRDGEASK